MTSDYRIGIGWNLAYAALGLLVPQCASDGVQIVERNLSASRRPHDRGLYIVLRWNVLRDIAMYQNLLDQFGLENTNWSSVTGWFPDFEGIYRRYSGYAYQPRNGREMSRSERRPRDIELRVTDLYLVTI